MHVFRISSKKYISDLSGEGARLNGGRWNREGIPVLYTGANVSVAAIEYFVHLKNKVKLKESVFGQITIEVSEGSEKEVLGKDIPGWPDDGIDREERLRELDKIKDILFDITEAWIAEGKYLCLKVPSVASPGDYNYLINTKHSLVSPDNPKIVGDIKDYPYDPRMFGKELDRSKSLQDLIQEAKALLGIK